MRVGGTKNTNSEIQKMRNCDVSKKKAQIRWKSPQIENSFSNDALMECKYNEDAKRGDQHDTNKPW